MEIAENFANFIVHTEFNDVHESVLEHIKKLTLKQVMGILVGSCAPTCKKVIQYGKDNLGRPECGVYGCGFKTDVAQAALINGFMGHASEFEDDQFPGGGISDVTTWPTLLTAAEKCKLSGKEIVVALYVGQEVQNRIAWHASVGTDAVGLGTLPFIGIYGATACCAKAYELTVEQTKASLGLAMVQGLGYHLTLGTDAHFWESATVCRNGVVNAIMAKSGATSNPAIEKSLDTLTGGDKNIDFGKMIEGLGKAPFYTNRTWIKKWGFCFGNHNFVDLLGDLMKKHGLKSEDIQEVVVHMDLNRSVIDRPEPKSTEDSRFSIQHILSYLMINGKCDIGTCTELALHDPRIVESRKRVKIVYHPEYPRRTMAVSNTGETGECRMDLTLKDAKKITAAMDQPYGSPKYPLTMGQVIDIFRTYCKGILPDRQIERVKDIILNMENETDLQEMFDICTFRHMTR